MIKRRDAKYLGLQILLMVVSLIVFIIIYNSRYTHKLFVSLSLYGLVVIILLTVNLVKLQKAVITISNLFFFLFVLFQFGMPITYVFSPNHYNYYFNLFNIDTQINALIYTQVAIQLFCIGMTLAICRNVKDDTRRTGRICKAILANPRKVSQAALLLFVITAVFAVPMNLRAAIGSMGARLAGRSIGIAYRGTMSENGFLRFIQEFFFPSALLYLCFSNNRLWKKFVCICYITVSLMLVIVADRNAGITSLVVITFYWYYSSKNRKSLIKNSIIILVIMVMGGVSVYIAQNRTSGSSLSSVLNGNIFIDALDEMGFNFTSICFVMSYIPRYDSFRYGLSYLAAFLLLLPKSFDFLGIYSSVQGVLGETWLWRMNNSVGRTNLSFGVGFSMIAESYYNFGWFGLLVMIPIAYLSTSLIRERGKNDNSWRMYIRLVLMLGFFTLPRRQFASMLKSIEYSLLFIALYLFIYLSFSEKRRYVNKKRRITSD